MRGAVIELLMERPRLVRTTREGKAVRYALSPDVGTRLGKVIDLGCCSLTFE